MTVSTVSSMWDWLAENYKINKTRLDRAMAATSKAKPHEAPAVEVGYGSYTTRVRVYRGPVLVGLVDFSSRETGEFNQVKLGQVRALLSQVGFEEK